MAYTLNSAKDARGDEHLFVQSAQKHRAAILAYKQKHGGDYERAYRAVTGQPWPAGRSLKFNGARAEMTKDRTVKSVLGKYVAPIAAAAVAPFALPALGIGGGAAAGSAGTAAGTAGTVAGTAATALPAVAGLSSAWLRPLLQYGVPAATGIVGQGMANSADERASGLEHEYLDKALAEQREQKDYDRAQFTEQRDYGRGQYADYLGRLNPYREAGTAAVGRASALLTSSRYRPELGSGGGGAGMVRLRDSRGEVRAVPAADADRFLQLGAVKV